MAQEAQSWDAWCRDEAVCFIAEGHHVTTEQLLRYCFAGEGPAPFELSNCAYWHTGWTLGGNVPCWKRVMGRRNKR